MLKCEYCGFPLMFRCGQNAQSSLVSKMQIPINAHMNKMVILSLMFKCVHLGINSVMISYLELSCPFPSQSWDSMTHHLTLIFLWPELNVEPPKHKKKEDSTSQILSLCTQKLNNFVK